ncbi:MAG: TonB-dependent receptor [Sphingobium sp.]
MAASVGGQRVGRFNQFVTSCSVPAMALACALTVPNAAIAQEAAADDANFGEIVVTAQKREQNINDVPMSITAVSGDQLKLSGVNDVLDLPKVTPGLTLGSSTTGTPVFTIRGVGYNDPAISARPAVTVYLDEAPIPFNGEGLGAGLDVERVEVLKGPQGTLFGNNSTGGAINYVAKKPTREFEAGGSFTFGRFNEMNIDAYVSGPISSTLSARLAAEHKGGNEWQRSYTRNDSLGRRDFTNGRFSLLWEPTSELKAQLTVTHWVDRSDAPAAQVYEIREQIPGLLGLTGLAGYPTAPRSNRAADWNPGENFARDNKYTQVTGRVDYDLSGQLTLTSISSYMRYHQFLPVDTDGTAVRDIRVDTAGDVKSFAQELRLAAKLDRLNAVVGFTYANDKPNEQQSLFITDSTTANSFRLGFGSPLDALGTIKAERITSYAAFGNLEYELTDQLTLQGGIRYTKTKDRFTGCTNDLGAGLAAAAVTSLLNNALRPAFGLEPTDPIQPGACLTFSPATLEPVLVENTLDEDNVSWRAGAQYKASRDLLLYANVSKGYKAGGFASLTAFTPAGLDPAVQESVLAYEAGFKAGLLDDVV